MLIWIQHTYILKIDGNYKKIKKLLKDTLKNIDGVELVYDTGSIEVSVNPYNFINIHNSQTKDIGVIGRYKNIFTNIKDSIKVHELLIKEIKKYQSYICWDKEKD